MGSKAQFVYVLYINAVPEIVWEALRDPESTKQFWGRSRNVSDWQVGSDWRNEDYDNPAVVDVVGKVLECTAPQRLALSWTSLSAGSAAPVSQVTIAIDPFWGAARLTLTHAVDEANADMLKTVAQGWPAILSSLKTLLETGRPLAMTTRRWGG